MSRSLASILVLGLMADLTIGVAAPPPPPPPPPQEMPESLDGYKTSHLWSIYGAQIRDKIPKARARLFERLETAIDSKNLSAGPAIILQHIYIEGRGEWYEGNVTAAVETVCWRPENTVPPECYLRARFVGAFQGNQGQYLKETFDLETAVSALKSQGIDPQDIHKSNMLELDLGFSVPVDRLEADLLYTVFDEKTCEQLPAATSKLLSLAEELVDQPSEIPFPHSGFVTVRLAKTDKDNKIDVYHLSGHNRLPVMTESNAFLQDVMTCLAESKTLAQRDLNMTQDNETPN